MIVHRRVRRQPPPQRYHVPPDPNRYMESYPDLAEGLTEALATSMLTTPT